jgi:sugar phosphate isomerase/epimerase
MQLSLTTDFVTARGDPEPHLRRIAEAGFRHVHWCHQWNTDYLYPAAEMRRLAALLRELGLSLNLLHGSAGSRNNWGSPWPWRRRAGIELVRNRLAMSAELGGDVIVMHAPRPGRWWDSREAWWSRFRRSLDALQPFARERRVRIALENMPIDNFDLIEQALAAYPPEYLGICYDAGHGTIAGNGLDRLEPLKARLIALHLHDNEGEKDRHWPLFRGTTDWPRLARLIATSGYAKPVMTVESNMSNVGDQSETDFLAEIIAGGSRFAGMVEAARAVM